LEDCLEDEGGKHYDLRPNGKYTTFHYPYLHSDGKGNESYPDQEMGILDLEYLDVHARTRDAITLLKAEL
jgi:hypothetical protein